ncbi:MAG: AAA family ATPase [Bacteroidales bacterium]|nr:AAA family ATPase [Bacteroidales bacterium]
MDRFIINELIKWKENSDRKPLILLGARQVGKTYILKKFGKEYFSNYIYINCHNNEFVEKLFHNFDIKRILEDISIEYNSKITIGKTLLIFDEVQEVKNGIASLKYFCEDARELHVAVAGSLLGISLKENESFPVGKVNMLRMYPMTFKEFLKANENDALYQAVENLKWDVLEVVQSKLIDILRQYYFVGGMPEAVAEYFKSKDISKVRKIHSEILEAYYADISKHSKSMVMRIHQVWESIPKQLAKENKKFVFGLIRKGSRASDFELAIQWLVDAGLVYKIERCQNPSMPLKFYANNFSFKLYLLDCGLLATLSETQPKDILLGTKVFTEFKGAFTENFVLQQLMPISESKLYYFSKDNSTMEIDFLMQCNSRVVPIEVKAEENVKSKSFSQFINIDFKEKELKGIRCSMRSYVNQEWFENIPLYSVNDFFEKMIK